MIVAWVLRDHFQAEQTTDELDENVNAGFLNPLQDESDRFQKWLPALLFALLSYHLEPIGISSLKITNFGIGDRRTPASRLEIGDEDRMVSRAENA